MMADQFDIRRATALIDLLEPIRRTRVVEVGSSPINTPPHGNLLKMGCCDVWGFEPAEQAFNALENSEHETYVQAAVGDGSKETFYLCKKQSFSSLLPPNPNMVTFFSRFARATRVIETSELQTCRIDDLDEVPEFDLLKIDVQGGELKVFQGSQEKLKSAQLVISEIAAVPLYVDQPLLDTQMTYLRGLGFDLHKFLFFKSIALSGGMNNRLGGAHRNQLLDGDAAFLRSLYNPEKIETEGLKHMAILADTVLESFDVTVRCLDLLVAREAIELAKAEAYVEMLAGPAA